MTISAKDRELLALLGENARMPIAAIAKRLGLSRTTVQTRLERLETSGIIAGYGVRLSEDYLATLIRAHVLVTIAPKSLVSVIATAPGVTQLDRVIDRIGEVPGVERTLTSIILSTRISR